MSENKGANTFDEIEITEDDREIVTLLDENGNEVRFDHLLTFKHLDDIYISLLPIDELENVGEDEVVVLKVDSSSADGIDRYVPIENERLLNEVFATFIEKFNEMLDEEDEREDQLEN